MAQDRTSIKVSKDVRDRLKAQKRAGESYEQLIDKMIQQYNPQEALQA